MFTAGAHLNPMPPCGQCCIAGGGGGGGGVGGGVGVETVPILSSPKNGLFDGRLCGALMSLLCCRLHKVPSS